MPTTTTCCRGRGISIIAVIAVALLARNVHECTAQSELLQRKNDLILPNPQYYLDVFDNKNNISFRTNFCDLQRKQEQDDSGLDLRSALNGQKVTVRMAYDKNYVNFLPEVDKNGDQYINPDNPGILVNIMDEVARRGGFSWRDSWHWQKPPPDGYTYTQSLVKSTDAFDISTEWWYHSLERIGLGISFPAGWYDGDLIIIARDPDEEDAFGGTAFRPFNWCRPFTFGVWAWLFITIIISGFVALLLEEESYKDTKNKAPIPGNKVSLFLSYIQKSFNAFTGEYDLFAKTHAGYILTFSLAFFALLMISAYTANLASFLVIQQEASADNVNTVNDIARIRKSMCMLKGSAVVETVLSDHPSARIVEIGGSDGEVLKALREERCDYAIVPVSAWDENKGVSDINSKCNLSRIGRIYQQLDAGFATKSDAGTLCTSLVRDVLNVYFEEMLKDGFIEEQWKKTLEAKHDVLDPSCTSSVPVEKDVNILDMKNLGGIFVLHFVFIIVSLCVAAWNKWYLKRKKSLLPKDSYDDENPKGRTFSHQTSSHETPQSPSSNQQIKASSTTNDGELEVLSERIGQLSTTVNEMSKTVSAIVSILNECKIESIPFGGDPP